jgi:hypothetical protein
MALFPFRDPNTGPVWAIRNARGRTATLANHQHKHKKTGVDHGRSTKATRIGKVNPGGPEQGGATANFGYVSGLTTTDVILLCAAAVAAFYLWKKL